MRLAMVGLGRMGGNMTTRLLRAGHEVVAMDLSAERREAAAAEGATGAATLEAAVAALTAPRVVWVMVPAGPPTRQTLADLGALLSPGDVVIDGGNSNYRDSKTNGVALAERGIHLVDAGVSGGVWGLDEGYCLMVGGASEAVAVAEPAFLALAPPDGYSHVGPSGAGHFVKMVHNGIEYGLMQAYAEGFELMHAADEFALDLKDIAGLWGHGSVVRSWLLELAVLALDDESFASVTGYVEDSGEGRWTVEEAVRRAVPAPVMTSALYARFSSRQSNAFGARLLAALRNQFGGHAVVRDQPK
ncbi:MAG TPA: decarboxylating 6-phosphogluconate dehydrogenase [Acidimicrobiales bacterium]|nr:decarboxylating 6-phosphogluconate dehydrogenase [Acidimicrobiales bacterium]